MALPKTSQTVSLVWPAACGHQYSGANMISTTMPVQNYLRSRVWANTSNFRRSRATKPVNYIHIVPSNAYTETKQQKILPVGQLALRNGAQTLYLYGTFATPGYVNPVLPETGHTALYNRCLQKIPESLNGSSFNLPLFLAELHKSTEMIANAARDLAKGLKKFRNNRTLTNDWLEYRYGWRLLLKDNYDGLVKIHDLRTRGIPSRCKVRATSKEFISGEVSRDGGINWYLDLNWDYQVNWRYRYTRQTDREVAISFLYTNDAPPALRLGTLQSLGITNPLNLAWELIPYSFVVDWFLPVGDYLTGLDTFIGKTFKAGCISYITNIKTTVTPCGFVGTNGYSVSSAVMPQAYAEERYYKRVPLSAFPSANLPRLQINLNLNRALDAISLVKQYRR